MSDNAASLVINLSSPAKDDVATAAFTIANAALGKGMRVAVFLTSDAVDLARSGAVEFTHVQPFKKLSDLIESFTAGGGVLWACAPCFNHRGLKTDETVSGAEVVGAGPMLDWVADGARTLSF